MWAMTVYMSGLTDILGSVLIQLGNKITNGCQWFHAGIPCVWFYKRAFTTYIRSGK